MAPTSSRLAPPFRELQPIPHATFACGSQTGRDWELGMDMFAVAGWALVERAEKPQGSKAQRCVTVGKVAILGGEAARDGSNADTQKNSRPSWGNTQESVPSGMGGCAERSVTSKNIVAARRGRFVFGKNSVIPTTRSHPQCSAVSSCP